MPIRTHLFLTQSNDAAYRCRGVEAFFAITKESEGSSLFFGAADSIHLMLRALHRNRCFLQSLFVSSRIGHHPRNTNDQTFACTANTCTCTNTHAHHNNQRVNLQKHHLHTTRLTSTFDRHEVITYFHIVLQVGTTSEFKQFVLTR